MVLSEDPWHLISPDSPMTSLPSDSFCSTVSILFNSVATTHSCVATTKGSADYTLSTQFNQHTVSVCQPVFNQHTVSVCSTHITLTFLCTLNTLHSLLSSALPTTHFTEQTPKLFNFVYTLHLWNGCRKAKHIKGMKVDTRVPGISFSKKDLALENLAGVPHVCTPINCRC